VICRLGTGMGEILGDIVDSSIGFLPKMAIFIGYSLASSVVWLMVTFIFFNRLDHEWDLKALILAVVATGLTLSFGAMWMYCDGKHRGRYSSLRRLRAVCYRGALRTNPIGIAFYCVRAIVWLVKAIPTILYVLCCIVMLIALGLTKCRMRSVAMVGAAVGVVVGFFWWNPVVVGLVGGGSACFAHTFSNLFRDWVDVTAHRMMPEFLG